MTKRELLTHMQTQLSDIIKMDEENWGLDEIEEDLDRAWHNGYAYAIRVITEKLDD